MIEHRPPNPTTQKHVLSASGNQCAFPGCSSLIFDLEHETLIGTICHIRARRENGPRFDPTQTEDENRAYGNLVAMCAEHSKIIDGPKSGDFSVYTLETWKIDHERRVAQDSDRSWIRPPNALVDMMADGQRLRFCYWIDRTGRPRLFTSHQLAVVNTLMGLNLLILRLTALPRQLAEAQNVPVSAVLQQDWANFATESSVTADICMLLAMAPDTTFAEFLDFVVQGNDATPLLEEGARRIGRMIEGEKDSIASAWYRSDLLA